MPWGKDGCLWGLLQRRHVDNQSHRQKCTRMLPHDANSALPPEGNMCRHSRAFACEPSCSRIIQNSKGKGNGR